MIHRKCKTALREVFVYLLVCLQSNPPALFAAPPPPARPAHAPANADKSQHAEAVTETTKEKDEPSKPRRGGYSRIDGGAGGYCNGGFADTSDQRKYIDEIGWKEVFDGFQQSHYSNNPGFIDVRVVGALRCSHDSTYNHWLIKAVEKALEKAVALVPDEASNAANRFRILIQLLKTEDPELRIAWGKTLEHRNSIESDWKKKTPLLSKELEDQLSKLSLKKNELEEKAEHEEKGLLFSTDEDGLSNIILSDSLEVLVGDAGAEYARQLLNGKKIVPKEKPVFSTNSADPNYIYRNIPLAKYRAPVAQLLENAFVAHKKVDEGEPSFWPYSKITDALRHGKIYQGDDLDRNSNTGREFRVHVESESIEDRRKLHDFLLRRYRAVQNGEVKSHLGANADSHIQYRMAAQLRRMLVELDHVGYGSEKQPYMGQRGTGLGTFLEPHTADYTILLDSLDKARAEANSESLSDVEALRYFLQRKTGMDLPPEAQGALLALPPVRLAILRRVAQGMDYPDKQLMLSDAKRVEYEKQGEDFRNFVSILFNPSASNVYQAVIRPAQRGELPKLYSRFEITPKATYPPEVKPLTAGNVMEVLSRHIERGLETKLPVTDIRKLAEPNYAEKAAAWQDLRNWSKEKLISLYSDADFLRYVENPGQEEKRLSSAMVESFRNRHKAADSLAMLLNLLDELGSDDESTDKVLESQAGKMQVTDGTVLSTLKPLERKALDGKLAKMIVDQRHPVHTAIQAMREDRFFGKLSSDQKKVVQDLIRPLIQAGYGVPSVSRVYLSTLSPHHRTMLERVRIQAPIEVYRNASNRVEDDIESEFRRVDPELQAQMIRAGFHTDDSVRQVQELKKSADEEWKLIVDAYVGETLPEGSDRAALRKQVHGIAQTRYLQVFADWLRRDAKVELGEPNPEKYGEGLNGVQAQIFEALKPHVGKLPPELKKFYEKPNEGIKSVFDHIFNEEIYLRDVAEKLFQKEYKSGFKDLKNPMKEVYPQAWKRLVQDLKLDPDRVNRRLIDLQAAKQLKDHQKEIVPLVAQYIQNHPEVRSLPTLSIYGASTVKENRSSKLAKIQDALTQSTERMRKELIRGEGLLKTATDDDRGGLERYVENVKENLGFAENALKSLEPVRKIPEELKILDRQLTQKNRDTAEAQKAYIASSLAALEAIMQDVAAKKAENKTKRHVGTEETEAENKIELEAKKKIEEEVTRRDKLLADLRKFKAEKEAEVEVARTKALNSFSEHGAVVDKGMEAIYALEAERLVHELGASRGMTVDEAVGKAFSVLAASRKLESEIHDLASSVQTAPIRGLSEIPPDVLQSAMAAVSAVHENNSKVKAARRKIKKARGRTATDEEIEKEVFSEMIRLTPAYQQLEANNAKTKNSAEQAPLRKKMDAIWNTAHLLANKLPNLNRPDLAKLYQTRRKQILDDAKRADWVINTSEFNRQFGEQLLSTNQTFAKRLDERDRQAALFKKYGIDYYEFMEQGQIDLDKNELYRLVEGKKPPTLTRELVERTFGKYTPDGRYELYDLIARELEKLYLEGGEYFALQRQLVPADKQTAESELKKVRSIFEVGKSAVRFIQKNGANADEFEFYDLETKRKDLARIVEEVEGKSNMYGSRSGGIADRMGHRVDDWSSGWDTAWRVADARWSAQLRNPWYSRPLPNAGSKPIYRYWLEPFNGRWSPFEARLPGETNAVKKLDAEQLRLTRLSTEMAQEGGGVRIFPKDNPDQTAADRAIGYRKIDQANGQYLNNAAALVHADLDVYEDVAKYSAFWALTSGLGPLIAAGSKAKELASLGNMARLTWQQRAALSALPTFKKAADLVGHGIRVGKTGLLISTGNSVASMSLANLQKTNLWNDYVDARFGGKTSKTLKEYYAAKAAGKKFEGKIPPHIDTNSNNIPDWDEDLDGDGQPDGHRLKLMRLAEFSGSAQSNMMMFAASGMATPILNKFPVYKFLPGLNPDTVSTIWRRYWSAPTSMFLISATNNVVIQQQDYRTWKPWLEAAKMAVYTSAVDDAVLSIPWVKNVVKSSWPWVGGTISAGSGYGANALLSGTMGVVAYRSGDPVTTIDTKRPVEDGYDAFTTAVFDNLFGDIWGGMNAKKQFRARADVEDFTTRRLNLAEMLQTDPKRAQAALAEIVAGDPVLSDKIKYPGSEDIVRIVAEEELKKQGKTVDSKMIDKIVNFVRDAQELSGTEGVRLRNTNLRDVVAEASNQGGVSTRGRKTAKQRMRAAAIAMDYDVNKEVDRDLIIQVARDFSFKEGRQNEVSGFVDYVRVQNEEQFTRFRSRPVFAPIAVDGVKIPVVSDVFGVPPIPLKFTVPYLKRFGGFKDTALTLGAHARDYQKRLDEADAKLKNPTSMMDLSLAKMQETVKHDFILPSLRKLEVGTVKLENTVRESNKVVNPGHEVIILRLMSASYPKLTPAQRDYVLKRTIDAIAKKQRSGEVSARVDQIITDQFNIAVVKKFK